MNLFANKWLMMCTLTSLITHAKVNSNILLQAPQLLTPEEIQKQIDQWDTQFTWGYQYTDFSCCYDDGRASFLFRVCKIPVRSYGFPYMKYIKKAIEAVRNSQTNYYYATPLQEQDAKPLTINCEELHTITNNKKIVFYTGAGISACANVATMKELEQGLSIHEELKTFLKTIFLNPQSITTNFETFCKSAINASPTDAHYALHEIAQKQNICIITENVDVLHHKAGSKPVHTHDNEISSLKPEDLQKIDIIVTIGLSHDDCGFLAYYKQCNPQGVIAAIDLKQPAYVSNNDYFVQGDAQVVIPALAKL